MGLMRSWVLYLIGALAIALAITYGVEEHRLNAVRSERAALVMQAANARAERDTTRDLALENARVASLAGDSLRIVERQVRQVQQAKDAVDDAIGRERVARYTLQAVIDSLQRTVSAVPISTNDDAIRAATFHLRQRPYTVEASVTIPEPPDSARIALAVAMDSLRLDARVRCSDGAAGERAAALDVAAPSWAHVNLGSVEQTPEVCALPSGSTHRGHRLRFRPISVAVGRALTIRGTATWGLVVGSSIVVE